MIVFASILGAILATALLALNPSPTIANAGAQMYGDQYGYDNNHQKKSSHTDIQKIKCVNSNINVNGVDITQIPEEGTATAGANEAGVDGANTQNGNGGLADRINFERNLVNICVNVNVNDQIRTSIPTELTCEECFTENLDPEERSELLTEIREISQGEVTTFEQLCENIASIVENGERINLHKFSNSLAQAFQNAGLSEDQFNTVLDCLNDIFNNAIPPPQQP